MGELKESDSFPHKDVKRWKHIGLLFSFDQSSYANLFSKEECFWKEWIDAKSGINHDVSDWFGSKLKKKTFEEIKVTWKRKQTLIIHFLDESSKYFTERSV